MINQKIEKALCIPTSFLFQHAGIKRPQGPQQTQVWPITCLHWNWTRPISLQHLSAKEKNYEPRILHNRIICSCRVLNSTSSNLIFINCSVILKWVAPCLKTDLWYLSYPDTTNSSRSSKPVAMRRCWPVWQQATDTNQTHNVLIGKDLGMNKISPSVTEIQFNDKKKPPMLTSVCLKRMKAHTGFAGWQKFGSIKKYLATLLSSDSIAFSIVKPVLNLKESINKTPLKFRHTWKKEKKTFHPIIQWPDSTLEQMHFYPKCESLLEVLFCKVSVPLPSQLAASDYKFPAPVVGAAVGSEYVIQSVTWNKT